MYKVYFLLNLLLHTILYSLNCREQFLTLPPPPSKKLSTLLFYSYTVIYMYITTLFVSESPLTSKIVHLILQILQFNVN